VRGGRCHPKFNAERLKSVASNPAQLATEAADYSSRKGILSAGDDIIAKAAEAEKPNIVDCIALDTLRKYHRHLKLISKVWG